MHMAACLGLNVAEARRAAVCSRHALNPRRCLLPLAASQDDTANYMQHGWGSENDMQEQQDQYEGPAIGDTMSKQAGPAVAVTAAGKQPTGASTGGKRKPLCEAVTAGNRSSGAINPFARKKAAK
jgi:hypothetical protein